MEIETTPVQYPAKEGAAPLLPPCRVCGEKASGFHYGANTCEACKGFFRRSLQRKEEYKCLSSGSCQIGVGRRNACAHCRWKKCIAVGMSKTAIKTGRYTHEKKTKDIEEVKRIQLREKMKAEGQIVVETQEEELEKIIKHITSIHQQQTPHTPEFFEKLPQKEKEFLEQRELQQKMFGTMKPIPREEYMQIYQSTGIDIDGRREMIKHMIPCIEKAIKRFITFAKALPGFKDLPIEDQIALIKVNKCDTWVIMAHRRFNQERKTYYSMLDDRFYHLDDFSKVDSRELWSLIFDYSAILKRLNLTRDECCMIAAVNMLLTGQEPGLFDCCTVLAVMYRCELIAPEKVEASLQLCLRCLLYLLRRNRPNEQFPFPKIVAALTELRSIEHNCQPQLKWTKLQMVEVDIPPLFYEFWSTN